MLGETESVTIIENFIGFVNVILNLYVTIFFYLALFVNKANNYIKSVGTASIVFNSSALFIVQLTFRRNAITCLFYISALGANSTARDANNPHSFLHYPSF